MIGMMNAGTVDVPAEFYGAGGRNRSGKKGHALFTKKAMLCERITYAKDGRMLVNGQLAASAEALSPFELWENLMMRVMCRAVCEKYIKDPPPPPKRRLSDFFPWRRHSRKNMAAANAIANAATAVSKLQDTRKGSVTSLKSLKLKDNKTIQKSSSDSHNFKENEQHYAKEQNARSKASNLKKKNFKSSDRIPSNSWISFLPTTNNNTAHKSNYEKYTDDLSNKNDSRQPTKVISFLKSSPANSLKSSTHADNTINSTSTKFSAKVTVNSNSSLFSSNFKTSSISSANNIVRSSSSNSLKSINALIQPSAHLRLSPQRARRPLSMSVLGSLTTKTSPSQLRTANTSVKAMNQTLHQQKVKTEARQPLHSLNNANHSTTPSRFFGICGSKISSATTLTNTKTSMLH